MDYDTFIQKLRAYQDSRILLTAIELDLFNAVGADAPAEEIAERLDTDPRATEMLLNALVAVEMLKKRDGLFTSTPMAAQYLTAGSPDNERDAWMHSVNQWARWSRLTSCIRTGKAPVLPEIGARGESWIRAFIAAMHRNAAGRAPQLVETVGASTVTRMLDIGGGSGAYSIAFALANPDLHAEVFDLPEVLPIAQGHIDDAGLTGRVVTRAGDLRRDDFGDGYDLILLSAICHMFGEDGNRDMLRRAYRALAPAGRVAIQDFVLEEDKTAPRMGAVFALNMLVSTHGGNSYSHEEYTGWLKEAGFRDVRRHWPGEPTGLIVGVRG